MGKRVELELQNSPYRFIIIQVNGGDVICVSDGNRYQKVVNRATEFFNKGKAE